MANHKRYRPKNKRAGCLLCKPWKANGSKLSERQRFSDYSRFVYAGEEIDDALIGETNFVYYEDYLSYGDLEALDYQP